MLSDTKLRAINGKPYIGKSEISDRDGLGVRVSPAGVISWQYRYKLNGKAVRLRLGRYPDLSLKAARDLIPSLRLEVEQGNDPRLTYGKKSTDIVTIQYCVDEFMRLRKSVLRDKTQNKYRAIFNKHFVPAFIDRDVDSIAYSEWLDFFDEKAEESPKNAGAVLTTGKTLFAWCKRRKIISNNPLSDIRVSDVGKSADTGTRTLSITECRTIWANLDKTRSYPGVIAAIKLCMIWGCRQGEILNATRDHFDLEELVWTVPAELSKTGKPIRRPITAHHLEILTEMWEAFGTDGLLLPSVKDTPNPISLTALRRSKNKVIQMKSMTPFNMHDFRRTIVTRLSELDVMPHVTEKMLGHELTGVMAVYNKHDWLKDQREAYELWCEKVIPSPL